MRIKVSINYKDPYHPQDLTYQEELNDNSIHTEVSILLLPA